MFGNLKDLTNSENFDIVWETIYRQIHIDLSDFISSKLDVGKTGRRSFLAALDFIGQRQVEITSKSSDIEVRNEIIEILRKAEKASDGKWKFVADFPVKNEVYQAPVIQFCNGLPRYDRFVIAFDSAPTFKLETDCVTTTPPLHKKSLGEMSLRDVIKYYDDQDMQRIAILGGARVFPYASKGGSNDEVEIEKFSNELEGIQEPVTKEIRDSMHALSGELKKLVVTLKFNIVPDDATNGDRKSSSIKAMDSYRKHLIEHKKALVVQRESLTAAKWPDDSKQLRAPILNRIEKIENRLWGTLYTTNAQSELDRFLGAMDDTGSKYTTLNGGWAGVQEDSMGMPMISSLFGIVHNSEAGSLYPPITIMPSVGSYDRVTTALDGDRVGGENIDISKSITIYLKNLIFDTLAKKVDHNNDQVFETVIQNKGQLSVRALSVGFKEELAGIFDEFSGGQGFISRENYSDFTLKLSEFLTEKNIASDVFADFPGFFKEDWYDELSEKVKSTYFEIDGVWGDDSKYLVAMSTGLLVFEPYGFWTNIEIANGVAQGKPVVIVADPASKIKFDEQGFVEKTIELPNGTHGNYRVYKSAMDAVEWFNQSYTSTFAEESGPASPRDHESDSDVFADSHKIDSVLGESDSGQAETSGQRGAESRKRSHGEADGTTKKLPSWIRSRKKAKEEKTLPAEQKIEEPSSGDSDSRGMTI